jgi:class 3 adenylate cyclase
MGLAILRSQHLDSPISQLAAWDGEPARGEAGTAVDVATWRRLGLTSTIVALEPQHATRSITGVPQPAGRVVRALLFGDLKGFSRLPDAVLPQFVEHVLGGFARVLEGHGDAVLFRNTWGDGLYLVLRDAASAASVALELQDCVERVAREGGFDSELALRVGAHLGPVFPVEDPVLGTPSFMGAHVSRTARIEPVTPEGAVYVTDRFAAALQLEHATPFGCEYVGHMPAAKNYGRLRMYRLVPA